VAKLRFAISAGAPKPIRLLQWGGERAQSPAKTVCTQKRVDFNGFGRLRA